MNDGIQHSASPCILGQHQDAVAFSLAGHVFVAHEIEPITYRGYDADVRGSIQRMQCGLVE